MMTYAKAVEFVSGLTDYEKSPLSLTGAGNYDLRRMEELLSELGNPQKGRKTVHVAGTKGKGSTSCMVASILFAAGYTTGLFTSPHLFSWQERIALNGKKVTQREFAGLAGAVKPYVSKLNRRARYGQLTTFEVLTAMALAFFNLKKAAVQVLEVGMGGRLDSTNVAKGDVCIITSISLDHTRVLGDTIRQIACEKAGIIKPGAIVVSAPQPEEAAAIIAARCRELNAQLVLTGRDLAWHRTGGDYTCQYFSMKTAKQQYDLRVPLLGDHQMENAACAIAAIEALQSIGMEIDYKEIVRGMAKVKWPLRLQVMGKGPRLIIDGAHNVYSLQTLVSAVKKYFPCRRAIIIFGSSSDKDIEGMAKELAGLAGHIILTSSSHARAAGASYLKQFFKREGVSLAENSKDALKQAVAQAGKEDIILATGSLFLAAEIKTESGEFGDFG